MNSEAHVIPCIFYKTHQAKAFNARSLHQCIRSLQKVTKATNRTSQKSNTQYYPTHSSVGTLRAARKLAPLGPANMPTDARQVTILPPHLALSSTIHEQGPRDNPRAGSLVSKRMQELYRLGDRMSPQRRERNRSHAAPLVHTLSSSAAPDGMPPGCGQRWAT
jgi:hypothetical protein